MNISGVVSANIKYTQEMQRYLTGNPDADREILLNVDERELLTICSPPYNQYSKKLCNENFWRARVNKYYPDAVKYKGKESWKNYLLSLIYYIDKLKREFDFTYSSGDAKEYYNILSARYTDSSKAGEAAALGALDLIDYLINKKRLNDFQRAYIDAARYRQIKILKYLEDKGFNNWNLGLYGAALGNNEDLIKYFEEKGATNWNEGLAGAAGANNIPLIEYFRKKGADDYNEALRVAVQNNSLDAVKYLSKLTEGDWNQLALEAAEEGYIDIIKYLSDKPGIDWREVYEVAQEMEQGTVLDYANAKIQGR